MRNAHSVIWNMAKTLKNMENEKHTLSNLDYRVKQLKRFKMRNAHSLTWNMAKNTEKHGP